MNGLELIKNAARSIDRSVVTPILGDCDKAYTILDDGTHWNPLSRTDDAVLLLSALKLQIRHGNLKGIQAIAVDAPLYQNWFKDYTWYEWLIPDSKAAFRRCITRAAADIGREMTK